ACAGLLNALVSDKWVSEMVWWLAANILNSNKAVLKKVRHFSYNLRARLACYYSVQCSTEVTMDIVLYYSPIACSLVPYITLTEANAKFEVRPVNLRKGQQNSADYLRLN